MLLILRISASSALSAMISQVNVRPLSGGGGSRTGTHQNEQSVGTADCVAITLRTFANRCHVRRWKPLVTSLETRLSPKASVSAAICCAVLHSEPTISEIRAVFVACRTPVSVRTALRTFSLGFPRVITCPCSLHFFALALRSISACHYVPPSRNGCGCPHSVVACVGAASAISMMGVKPGLGCLAPLADRVRQGGASQ